MTVCADHDWKKKGFDRFTGKRKTKTSDLIVNIKIL